MVPYLSMMALFAMRILTVAQESVTMETRPSVAFFKIESAFKTTLTVQALTFP
jgi:hypothetical protein